MNLDKHSGIQVVNEPDAAWRVAMQTRRAVLWIGSGFRAMCRDNENLGSSTSALGRLLLRPWGAVFIDTAGLPVEAIRDQVPEVGGNPLRIYTEDPPSDPPRNRLPIYVLPRASASAPVDAMSVLHRLRMLQRVPADADVFAVGISGSSGLAGLVEAASLSEALRKLVVVGPELPQIEDSGGIERVVHWSASLDDYLAFLEEAGGVSEAAGRLLLVVRTGDSEKSIDLEQCVDLSNPITASFETIAMRDLRDGSTPSLDDLRGFLANPAASWRPYAVGIPFARHESYRRTILKRLSRFTRDGAAATETIWLQAEDGSGATTVVRQLAFDLAQAGYPVLVARPDVDAFNFQQLSAFLTRAGERFAAAGISATETPWLIVFDAQHSQLHWEFVTGVAAGLKKLQRPAVVLAVRTYHEHSDDARRDALDAKHYLKPPLRNTVTVDEATSLGDHFAAFLPQELRRSRYEWSALIEDTLRISPEGSRSLFWVALRFWLLRVPGSDAPVHAWLQAHLDAAVSTRQELYAALLETAALSKYRLEMPVELLVRDAVPGLREMAADASNLLGLIWMRRTRSSSFSLAHPLSAEELLRLASRSDRALVAVGMPSCVSAFDLELHLLERILTREQVGTVRGVRLVEELVTSALRVDPREAPRNFAERDRIVRMLERVPDVVWDDSQIFNHHLAKARRHLAVEPPDQSWGVEAIREQLELAENHLLDAIDNIRPSEEARAETPLNLKVSLALTYDARARLEQRAGEAGMAARYREAADSAYRAAQRIDADNFYVLENFARFKLSQLGSFAEGEDRVRIICDAIALLEWERQMDQDGRREEPILMELATAYEYLEHGDGRAMLSRLARDGSEPALVALSQLAMRGDEAGAVGDEELAEAERLLRLVPVERRSSRSIFALYRLVSRRRPFDFLQRVDLLVALEGDPDFAMPLQVILEFGILLFQTGASIQRKKGEEVFRRLREQLGERSGSLFVPDELRYLRDPATEYRERLKTAIIVRNLADGGRNYFGIPYGWHTVKIPMRVYDFGLNLRAGTERDCYVRFTNFGPQAVPPTLAEE